MIPGNMQRGVMIPASQRAADTDKTDLPSLSLHNFNRLETFAGQYVDSSGRLVPGFFVKFGDDWYLDPNGPSWFANLKPISEKLLPNVRSAHERIVGRLTNTAEIPTEDKVEIMAAEPTPAEPPADVDVVPAPFVGVGG